VKAYIFDSLDAAPPVTLATRNCDNSCSRYTLLVWQYHQSSHITCSRYTSHPHMAYPCCTSIRVCSMAIKFLQAM